MKIALLITSLSMFLTPVCAQKMSLNDCMRYAVEHNTEVNKQSYQNYIYKQDKLNAVGNLLPHVTGYSNGSRSNGRSIDYETNTYTDGRTLSNTYGLDASMSIFKGFSGVNTVRATHAMSLMGKEKLQQIKDEKALAAMEQFFNVVYYTQNVQNVKDKLAASQQTLFKAQKMAELGMKSDGDVAQIEADVASNDLQLIQEENQLEIAILNLKDAMNFPFEDTLDIDTNLPIEMVDGDIILPAISKEAIDNQPKMKASEYNLRYSQLSYASYKGQLLPSISLGASYSTNYYKDLNYKGDQLSYFSQLKNKGGTSIFATINIPIFTGLNGFTSMKRAKGRMKIAEVQNTETKRALQLEMAQASMKMNGYAKEFIQATKKVESADLAYQLSVQKFDKGLVDVVDMQTNANTLLTAKSQKLQARLYYLLKYRLVEYYNGLPLIREQ